ncbi:MAG: MBL fold metallo-hydrolase [Promethearchaeota archaeon]
MTIKPIRNLKILTLVENMVGGKSWGSWGLSFLLEFQDASDVPRKILFDTGGDKNVFMHNVKVFEANINELDAIVLSHGHWDHAGALVEVSKSTGGVKLYTHPEAFFSRYHIKVNGKKREIGIHEDQSLDKIEAAGGKVVFSTKPIEIVPGVWTTGEVERNSFERVMELNEGEKLVKNIDGTEADDLILDDQSLWADVEDVGPIVLVGCAHAGLLNIINQVARFGSFSKFHGLIGGTHLVRRQDSYIDKTIEGLRRYNFQLLSPCHCTGFKATTKLWYSFPNEFYLNYSGREFEIGQLPEQQVF